MEFISDLLSELGSGIVSFLSSLVQALVPNFEALIYKGAWTDEVWTKAAGGGYTAIFGYIVVGLIIAFGFGIFSICRKALSKKA